MVGSGDAAFTRSFNPYTGSVNNGQIMKGAIYEPLTISVVAKGGHVYPWLAKSWTWSRDKKTLNLQIQPNVKWSDGKPLTAADVVYSLTAGKQDSGHTMDIIGLYRANTNIASIKQVGPLGVAITLKTPDSQFIAANLNLQFVVPQHIWSKVKTPATFKNPTPVGSGPFTTITRLTTQDVVYGKNPNYWQAGQAGRRLPRLPGGHLERRRAAPDAEWQGRLDAQLRGQRRDVVPGQGSGALPRLLRHRRVSRVAHVRRHAVPLQPRRVPPGRQHGDQPRRRLEARRVRLRAAPPTLSA